MTEPQTPRGARKLETSSGRPWLVALVVGVGTLLSAMAGSTVTLALPELGRELEISIDLAGWVMASYLLAVTVLLLPAGRASDLLGHRAVYLVGFGAFGAASLAAGLAPSFPVLIGARLAQGIGGALVMAAAPALLTTSFPASQRGRALGIVATATYTGLTVGPPLGGLLIATFGWRSVFFLNVPIAFLLILLGRALLPPGERHDRSAFDWPGLATLSAGLPLLLAAVVQGPSWGWASLPTVGLGATGAALLAAFVAVERHARAPLIRPDLFRSRVFTGATLSALANYLSLFVPIILLPFCFTEGMGLDPSHAGLLLSVQPLVMAVVASPSGWLSDRLGSRGLATSGMAVLALGVAGLAHAARPGVDATHLALWLAVMGLGTGVFISPNSSALMGAAPRRHQGIAGGILAVARSLGMMAGVAAAVTIFAAAGGRTGHAWISSDWAALRVALGVAAGVAAFGAVAAALRGPLRTAGVSPRRPARCPPRSRLRGGG